VDFNHAEIIYVNYKKKKEEEEEIGWK